MAELLRCTALIGAQSHNRYSKNNLLPTHLVRITCAYCGYYLVDTWCDECYQGVRNSGKTWRCKGCSQIFSNENKLQHVIRIGDI